ncbi:MAG: hypothetical protein AAFO07_16520 [Bacteroidota bacterium]
MVKNQQVVQLKKVYKNHRKDKETIEETLASESIQGSIFIIKAKANGTQVQFFIESESGDQMAIGEPQNSLFLSTRNAGGFTGAYVGMFATANGQVSTNQAQFDWFEYRNIN